TADCPRARGLHSIDRPDAGQLAKSSAFFWCCRSNHAPIARRSCSQAQRRETRPGFQKFSLDENIDRAVERSSELIALDDALKALAAFDEQKARMVELRYFGGLS